MVDMDVVLFENDGEGGGGEVNFLMKKHYRQKTSGIVGCERQVWFGDSAFIR